MQSIIMRDLGEFLENEINDINAKSLLLKWFNPRHRNISNYNNLSTSSRYLSEQEKSKLKECLDAEKILNYNLAAEFLSGSRLQVRNEVYHSKQYRSMEKPCSKKNHEFPT